MEQIKKAREAIELLKQLNLPVIEEQIHSLNKLEREYVQNEVIPLMKQEMEPLLDGLMGKIEIEAVYDRGNGLNLRVVTAEERPRELMPKVTDNSRDTSKFSLDGGVPLKKRRFVLATIKKYVSEHPVVTYHELKRQFPDEISNNLTCGVFCKYDYVCERIKSKPDIAKRFFMEPDELINLADGTIITVYNQWGENFSRFLEVARKFYDVQIYL